MAFEVPIERGKIREFARAAQSRNDAYDRRPWTSPVRRSRATMNATITLTSDARRSRELSPSASSSARRSSSISAQ